MSRQRERDEFIATMTTEGVRVDDARRLMRYAATLQRIAELQCSSEAADRDRVPCPGAKRSVDCICEPSAFGFQHERVPRINVQEQRTERRVVELLAPYGIKPVFQGDPRGAVLKLQVPSGKTDDWGQVGICVPS